jgi:hypothetical protein
MFRASREKRSMPDGIPRHMPWGLVHINDSI